ncbi:tetratricopeptide repeat protein [Streptomyces sp. NPDC057136]|uniref:tetratricopeptide repeat protein n=1 Tax=Streptomyces sp. NPDC057136 TaxID=3346029 RepID=UPI0036398CDA
MGIEDLRRLHDENVRTLGEGHPSTLVARGELAHAYYQAREYVKAFGLQEQLLAGVVRALGADDRLTASTLTDLASIWFSGWLADGRPELALPLYELAVSERVRVTGVNDPGTLSARSDLATAYVTAGQGRRGIATFEQGLVDCLRVLGEGHSLTQTVRGNLESLAGMRDMLERNAHREEDDAAMAREIASAFAEVLGLEPRVSGGRVSVAIPAIGESLSVPVCDVKRLTKSYTPMGDAALEFVMIEGDDVRPLIVLADNVLFAPEDPVVVLQSPIPVVISNAPLLISYAEMVADAERFAMAAVAGGTDSDVLAGTGLLVRCVIAGAVRFGLRSLRAVAWWQRGWEARAGDWNLPPFPKDPVWEHLTRSASSMTLTPSVREERVDESTVVGALTVGDFEALESRLLVAQLDEEFVATWKTLMPITPARFTDLLTDRLIGAQADITLYPDGAGSADLVLRNDGESQAVLQLRFDFRTSEITIDEIRIMAGARGRGLFQRLQYNTEQLARALGLRSLKIMATDIGSVAFAKAGFPQDPELFAKVHAPAEGRPGPF